MLLWCICNRYTYTHWDTIASVESCGLACAYSIQNLSFKITNLPLPFSLSLYLLSSLSLSLSLFLSLSFSLSFTLPLLLSLSHSPNTHTYSLSLSLSLTLSQMFSRAKQGLLAINSRAKHGTDQEKKVAKNVMSSLALTLQNLSTDFRKAQTNYLKS